MKTKIANGFVKKSIWIAAAAAILVPGMAATSWASLSGFGADNTGPAYTGGATSGNISATNNTVTMNFNANNGNKATPPTIGTNVPSVSGNVLTLTTPFDSESSSVWFNTKQNVGSAWTASFTQESSNQFGGGADGFYFVVQDNSAGLNLLGGSGGYKGYIQGPNAAAPTNSVGIGVETYPSGYGLQVAGMSASSGVPQTTLNGGSTGSVDFSTANSPVNVTISYDGGTNLTFSATQGTTGSFSYTVALPESVAAILGSSSGYVGLTGGTGGAYQTETISNFTFGAPVPEAPAGASLAGGLLAIGSLGLARRGLRRRG